MPTRSPRDLFRHALRHEDVRPVPFSVKFTHEARARYAAHLGRAAADFDPILDTGSCVVASHTNDGWREVRPGHFRDHFGVVWDKTQDATLGVATDPPLAGATFAGYRFPDPADCPVYAAIERNNARYPDRFHMLSLGFTLFERAWALTGMENLFTFFLTEPDFISDLLDRIADYQAEVIRLGARIGRSNTSATPIAPISPITPIARIAAPTAPTGGLDAVHFGDDWGGQTTSLIRPELWREFVLPRFARLCAAAREAGLLVSHHSCGAVEPLLDDMVAAGVNVFDPFQPEAMDIWAVRERYRGRLAFWGGLSVQRTLPFGTPDDVRRETRRLLAEMAPGGGYILSPSHSLTADIPPENIAAFLDVAREQ